MANTILIRNNTTGGAVPLSATFAQVNELLYNSADGILYMKKADNTVLAFHADDGTYSLAADEGVANGIATLDGNGKLLTAQLPDLAITDTYVVADEAAMLALDAQQGDVAVRTDENKNYILTTSDPSVLANWTELLTPTDLVLSVAGRTGNVVLAKTDITDFDDADYATAAQGALAGTAVQPGDNVSDLTNDANYATDSDIAGKEDSFDIGDFLTMSAAGETVTTATTVGGQTQYDNKTYTRVNSGTLDTSSVFTADSSTGIYSYDAGGGDYYIIHVNSTNSQWNVHTDNVDPSTFVDGNTYTGVSGGVIAFNRNNDVTLNGYAAPGDAEAAVASTAATTRSLSADTGTIATGAATDLVTADDAKTVTDAIASDVTDIEAKTDFITVTQSVDLDDIESKANAAAVAADLATADTVGKGTDLIEVNDSGSKFTATSLTDVLIELDDRATTGIGADTITQTMMQDDSIGTAEIIDANVTEAKLNASVNASLDLADSALQSGDNVSALSNDAGYLTTALQDGDTISGGTWS